MAESQDDVTDEGESVAPTVADGATEPSEATSPETPRRNRTKLVLAGSAVVIALLAAVAVFGGGNDKSIGAQACHDIESDEDMSVAEAQSVANAAAGKALAEGEGAAFLEDFERECPAAASLILGSLGAGGLADDVDVKLGTCSDDEINGTLVNNSGTTVDVTISYELTTAGGTRVDDGLVFVDRVGPGQRVAWDQHLFDVSYSNCEIDIDRVFPS